MAQRIPCTPPMLVSVKISEGTYYWAFCFSWILNEWFVQDAFILFPPFWSWRRNAALVHLWVNNGQKPFKCNHCYKLFLRKDHLTVHRRMYTGQKLHKCTVCNKSFIRNGNLTVCSSSYFRETNDGLLYIGVYKLHIIFTDSRFWRSLKRWFCRRLNMQWF